MCDMMMMRASQCGRGAGGGWHLGNRGTVRWSVKSTIWAHVCAMEADDCDGATRSPNDQLFV